ncbi:MAG: Calx-beta domain-containing protein [Gloeotrichia echinulata DEX184]|nr:hypothetical protein [Gloeotrichia echinulata DEX184]
MSNILNPIYNQLSDFSGLENFWNLFETAFGTEYNHTVAANLRSQWQAGDFSQFPKVEVILSDSLDNANGTYDSSTNKIYLSASFVTTAKPETVNAFLLKEIGNFVDAQVNQSNTSGNKGANFAGVVLGNSLTEEVQSVQPSSDIHNAGCSCSSCALPPVDPKLFNNQQEQLVEAVSATLDLSQTFFLNSLAGANHTIYLDFNGHTTTGTSWNTSKGLTNIFTPAYDFDGNTASFSSAELERIQYIWQRVVEDFSPFNVNVTTQAPTDINDLIKSGTGDTRWGVRVAIGGSSSDWYGSGAGGVAYLNSFNWNSDTPTYVFSDSLYDGEKSTAEAISHEVGHTLGLRHDGLPTQGYYGGHGSGDTGWAPIMGVGYSQNLSQWSKGQYSSANNTEDDLQIITTQNGFGYRVDDTGNTIATAKSLTLSGTSWSGSGIIERNTDIDFYSFSTGAGALNLTVNPFSRGPNLDILAQLYNSAGTLIASSNPTDLLSASITTNVVAGTYYLAIDGVGKGDPLSTGYTDYGSLGQYFINGKIDALTYASFSNSGAISIPISGASNPYPSTINVSGVSGNIANLKVTLTNLNHTWADDIDILLVGPTGAKIILMSDVGGSSDLNNVTFTFDASATAALSDEGQLTSGTYLPTDFESGDTFNSPAPGGTYGTDLSVFNNTNPNGVWSLYVVDDDGGGDSGTITGGWSLSIGTDSSLPFITLALSPASVLENGTTNLVYTFTRSGATTNALTVNYGITGTADSSDYTGATPGTGKTITFAAGSSTATLTIDPTADTTIESDETVALTLATGTGYTIGTTTAVTGTILNDDTSVTLAVAPSSVAEDGTTNLVYTFTRSGFIANALTVNYNVGGTATFNNDYTQIGAASFTATTGTITFAAGSSTATLTIDPTADTTVETDETVALTLATGTGYNIGTTTAVTGTILNDDTSVTLAVTPSSVNEDGTTNLVYTFTRTGFIANALTVNYNVGGTATFNNDYTQIGAASFTATTGTITFAAGATTATLTIDPTADTTVETDETVALTLATGTGYNIGTTTAVTGTILNDDTSVTLAVTPSSVAEDGTTNLVYTFTRSGFIANALTVNYNVGGTATFNNDYTQIGAASFTATTGTITFAAGSSTATLTIDPTADTTVETDETVALTLATGTGYNIGTTTAVTGTILNDDTSVTLAVTPSSVAENGTTNLVYTFTRTGFIANALTVNYNVGGTATFNNDYSQIGAASFTATTGTITFAAGATTATLTIDPTADTTVETDETVALTLATGTGYNIGTTTAVTGTILNDDTSVTLAVTPSSVAENGTTNLVYTFTRTGFIANALTVNYNVGGTATFNNDYSQIGAASFTATTGTITFAAGSSTATLTIDPTADTTVETDETVALTLATGTGYNIGTTTAVTGSILNDDTSVTLAVTPSSVTENGTTNLVYTFTRSGFIANALTVNYNVGGTATFNNDYTQIGAASFTTTTGTITFAAGSSTATLTIDPTADTTVETDETVALTLATGTGYNIGTTTAVTGSILNDDTSVTLAVTPSSVTENGTTNLVYTFTRTGVTTNALTVNYNVGGTATFNSDYTQIGAASFTATTGTITFAAGSSTATLTIDPTADTTVETDETVALTLATGTGYNIGTTTAVTGTILNDDTSVTLAVTPSSVAEDGTTNLVYTFTRTGVTTNALTVNYNVGGTATFNNDYTQIGAASFTTTTGTITFAAGSSTATLTIDPTADTTVETDETVALTLATGTGYNIGTTTAVTGSILNDDTSVTLAVTPSSVTEDGTTNLVYTFTRSGFIANALTVNYNVGGTATFNSDYTQIGAASFTATTGTITFAAGSSTATLTIDPTADTTVETDETVALTLATGTGYNIGTTTAVTGSILNDDVTVTLAIAPSSVAEDGTTNLVYTFTRSGFIANALTVNYNVGGTATFNNDYTQIGAASFTATTGTITFAAGSSTATLTIDPTPDTTYESDETVALTLATGTGYNIGTTTAVTGTILNNDFQPTINLSASQTLVEGNTSPQNASYTVTLSNASSQTITVNYATANGSATAGLDYTSTTGTLTFNPGVTSQVINIPILNDSINEANETFTLTLTSPTNASLGTTTTVTTTLTDTLTASVTTTLPANVENLTLTGTAAINGTGNAGDNILKGNSGNNILSGGDGNDTYVFVATSALGTDTITETTTGGTDTLNFTGTTAAVNVNLGVTTSQTVNSNLKLIFSANNVIENVTGGTGNDRITGNTLNNTLIGGDGNDQLQGLGGDDVLWGGNGNDILTGGTGNDTYLFQSNGVFTSSLGVDYITQFDVGLDNIVLSKTTFNAVTNTVGQALTDFAVVSDDEFVNASDARIVFSQSSGSLFYNQDGNVLGTGTVFEFARLGNPDITLAASNFSLIA